MKDSNLENELVDMFRKKIADLVKRLRDRTVTAKYYRKCAKQNAAEIIRVQKIAKHQNEEIERLKHAIEDYKGMVAERDKRNDEQDEIHKDLVETITELEKQSYKDDYFKLRAAVIDMSCNRTGTDLPEYNPTLADLLEAIDNQDIDYNRLEKEVETLKGQIKERA